MIMTLAMEALHVNNKKKLIFIYSNLTKLTNDFKVIWFMSNIYKGFNYNMKIFSTQCHFLQGGLFNSPPRKCNNGSSWHLHDNDVHLSKMESDQIRILYKSLARDGKWIFGNLQVEFYTSIEPN